jgi:hypothetical protein
MPALRGISDAARRIQQWTKVGFSCAKTFRKAERCTIRNGQRNGPGAVLIPAATISAYRGAAGCITTV